MSASRWCRCLITGVLVGVAAPAAAQTGVIAGRVIDRATGAAIGNARVEAYLVPGRGKSATTDAEGRFRLADLVPGSYSVVVSRIGTQLRREIGVVVREGATTTLDVVTSPIARELAEVVTTASRRQEKVLDAPASVSVITQQEIESRPALTPTDHIRGIPGIDVSSGGLMQANVVARGFNNIFSGALLTLTDNRFASVPSLRVNVPYLVPITNEDIERIEIVLGPGAALYGPNSANGVMHIITKSPFQSEGGSLTLGAGERSVVRGGLRYAQALGSKVAYKISGDWMQGDDWHYTDPAEPAANKRDFALRRWAGEARVDVRPTDNVEWITSYGRVNAGSAIELTGTSGAAQVKDWTYESVQTRLRAGRLFGQVFANFSNAGETRLLRTNSPIVDESRVYVGQLQHGFELFDRFDVTYGGDYQRTEPRTGGTINGRNEDDDVVTEYGGYLHTVTRLSEKLDFLAAARLDQNDRVTGSVFSPRAALVFKPAADQNIRLTYNRGFSTPSNFNLFLDLPSGTIPLGPLGTYRVVALGVPKAGLHFRRDCAGLCMRTPLAAIPGTAATPSAFLEADATLRWRSAVEIAIAQNPALVFLRTLPAPTKASVSSNLAVLNPTTRAFNVVNASDVTDIEGLKPSLSSTYEVGYKGLLGNRVRLALDVWYDDRRNFVGPSLVETPNVFLDSASTARYLANFPLPPGTAQAVAGGLAKIPLGTISPDHPLTNTPGPDIIVTYRNYGKLNVWGSDVASELSVTDRFSMLGTYSWVNKDLFPRSDVGGLSDVTLNAPANKATLTARFRDEVRERGWELRGRYVAGFPVKSGVYDGTVKGYTLLDANVDYKLPVKTNVYLSLSAQNLLDSKHREFVGVPELGRFVMTQLRYTF